MGIEYEVRGGAAYAACQASYPNLYFMFDGHWLQIPAVDYIVDTSEGQDGQICRLRIRPIDAPFNIMGMPVYLGYYVTHNWEESYMSFAPHDDSSKPALEAGSVPKAQLAVKYESTNTENGDTIAF